MIPAKSLVLFFVCMGYAAAAHHQEWDYDSDDHGVAKWPELFPVCAGTSQSPIDIKNPKYDSSLGDVKMENYDGAVPSSVTATANNNGHTYGVSFNGFTSTPKISEGGLPGTYGLAGFHFHWGSDDTKGSEHTVNGMAYPAELHFVHLNEMYENVSVGVSKWDGLAVLGVFLKVGEHNNNYNFLNMTTPSILHPNTSVNFQFPVPLMNLFPTDKSFYRYNGSLTTPGCQEAVTWTVFEEYVEISEAQLNNLRSLFYHDDNDTNVALVNNYRPPQPLHGRMLLANFEDSSPTASGTPKANTPKASTPMANTESPKMSTTDGASSIAKNSLMFLASFFMILLTSFVFDA